MLMFCMLTPLLTGTAREDRVEAGEGSTVGVAAVDLEEYLLQK